MCILLMYVAASAVAAAQTNVKVTERLVSVGMHHPSHPRKIDVVIVHSCYNPYGTDKYSLQQVLDGFKHYHVSAHYIIDRQGIIYQLVKEQDISYHAGKSKLPDGRTWVNSCSIGIEMITSTDSTDSPTLQQQQSLITLVRDIKARYPIKYVLRHSDIAPQRKTDPWNFNWEEFKKRIE